MTSNKASTLTSVILSLAILFITGVALIIGSESSGFLTILAAIFLVCSLHAFIVTTVHNEKQSLSQRIVDKILPEKKTSPKQEYGGPYISESFTGKQSTYKQTHSNSNDISSSLSVRDYLFKIDHQLNDEIIDVIEWKRFELLCHLIFDASGYKSELTGDGADEGVDIRIYDTNIPSKTLYLVQCKKYRGNRKISREQIQQLRGQMATENVEKGGYCSTGIFTGPAREYAKENNIEIFDKKTILKSFNKLNDVDRELILRRVLDGDYWTPSCATCGEKFEPKKTKSGNMIWMCNNSNRHGWSKITYYEAAPINNVH